MSGRRLRRRRKKSRCATGRRARVLRARILRVTPGSAPRDRPAEQYDPSRGRPTRLELSRKSLHPALQPRRLAAEPACPARLHVSQRTRSLLARRHPVNPRPSRLRPWLPHRAKFATSCSFIACVKSQFPGRRSAKSSPWRGPDRPPRTYTHRPPFRKRKPAVLRPIIVAPARRSPAPPDDRHYA